MATIEINYRDMIVQDVLAVLRASPMLTIEKAVVQTLKATGRQADERVIADISNAVSQAKDNVTKITFYDAEHEDFLTIPVATTRLVYAKQIAIEQAKALSYVPVGKWRHTHSYENNDVHLRELRGKTDTSRHATVVVNMVG